MKKQITKSSIQRSMRLMLPSFCIALALSLVATVAVADDPPGVPLCNGRLEPSSYPYCGRSPNCTEKNPCLTGTYGQRTTYCCDDRGDYCIQYTGKWRCCNGRWMEECKKEVTASSSCTGGNCSQ